MSDLLKHYKWKMRWKEYYCSLSHSLFSRFPVTESCSSSTQSSDSNDSWDDPAKWTPFRSHWVESLKFLDAIYERDSDVARGLVRQLQCELENVFLCIEGAEAEKKRIAESAAKQVQREAVTSWVQEQKRRKQNDE